MKSDNKDKIKIIPSLFLMIGVIFLMIMMYSIFIFLFAYPVAWSQIRESIFLIICLALSTGVLPTIIFIGFIFRGTFSVITIDERGIRQAFLGCLLKRQINWDEIKQMRYIFRVIPHLFISTKSIEEFSFDKLVEMRGVIQISLTKKVARIIRKYTDLPITGMSEEELQEYIQEDKEKSQ